MTDDTTTPVEPRLDETLRTLRRTLKRRTGRILAEQGIAWHEWMLLRSLASDGAPRFAHPRVLRSLHERGWVAPSGDGPVLTEFGRAAVERTEAQIATLRTEAAAAVSADDLTVTLATLTAIAERLGADLPDEDPTAHPFHGGPFGRRGFGPFGGRGFGRRHGFGREHGVDDEHGGCGPHGRHPHPFDGPNRHRGFGPGEGADPRS